MVIFTVFLLVYFLVRSTPSFPDWRSLMAEPVMTVASTLFLFSLLAHAWIGIRDVVMDYVHPLALRVAVLTALAGALLAMAVWGMRVLFTV